MLAANSACEIYSANKKRFRSNNFPMRKKSYLICPSCLGRSLFANLMKNCKNLRQTMSLRFSAVPEITRRIR